MGKIGIFKFHELVTQLFSSFFFFLYVLAMFEVLLLYILYYIRLLLWM